jgi:hypothetical protein
MANTDSLTGKPGIAGFQAQIGSFLKRGDFAPGVATEEVDVGFVPGFERVRQAVPAFGEFPVEVIRVAQIFREPGGILIRPGGRGVVHLKDLQPGVVLDAHAPFVTALGRVGAARGFQLRPAPAVADPFHAGQSTERAGFGQLRGVGVKPRHAGIDRDRGVVGRSRFGQDARGDPAGAATFTQFVVPDRQLAQGRRRAGGSGITGSDRFPVDVGGPPRFPRRRDRDPHVLPGEEHVAGVV